MLFDNDKEAEDEYPYMHQYTNYMKKMTRPLVGREHEKEQVMAAMLKPEYCNVLLLGEAGSGKAQPNDTLVPVADDRGYVRIGDLKPGDSVFDENGDPTEVLGVFPQGMQECFEVGFTDGTAAKCNDRHLWQARRRKKGGGHDSYDVHTLRYMMERGFEIKDRKSGKKRPVWEVPVNHALDRSEAEFGKDPYQAGTDACDGHSCDREVPREYIKGSMAQRIMLLHGLMDANGDVAVYKGKACAFFSTGTKALADFVQELAASLGYRTVRHSDDGYCVSFVTDADESQALFSVRHAVDKVKRLAEEGKKFPKRPKSVGISYMKDLGYECEMTCIYVAAQSHLYQTGKEHIVTHNTALVQGIMVMDTDRMYLEVDLSKMIANLKNENEMADRLKTLFDEVSRFKNARNKEIVLFIDEFHQIVQLSPAAVEVLKPLLADSGTRGIRVIAATTHVEYQQFIAPNLPLVERLQRIKLVQPGEDVVISILRSMCERYGVVPASPELFSEIYEYTNRYIPATSQPRKSILILDSMIGWHRLTRKPLDRKLLADVIYETEGINVAFRVNAATIKKKLDEKVLAQQVATSSIEQRLQICVAGLNNPNRPMSSFLFAGSTGVGKTEATKQLANILYDDDRNLIRFDMTEFALPDSLNRFRKELTNRVSTIPYCLILFDEIEKACGPVTRVLLQVLDDGRLLDENEREVTFKNAYIIVTTNSGAEIFRTISNYESSDKADMKTLEKYDKLLREAIKNQSGSKFPPELLGRIDCIVPFQPLSRKTMMGIVQMKLKGLARTVKAKHGVSLHIHKDIYMYLIYDKLDTDSDSGGARIVVSKLERELTVPLARYINEHPNQKEIFVSIGGRMAIENKRQLESEAYVYVGSKFLRKEDESAVVNQGQAASNQVPATS